MTTSSAVEAASTRNSSVVDAASQPPRPRPPWTQSRSRPALPSSAVRRGRSLGHDIHDVVHRGLGLGDDLVRRGHSLSHSWPRPPWAGVKFARRSCARRSRRHLNCTRRLPKLRTPYRTLHTCSMRRVQYGVHNSRILTTLETTAQPSLPLHGEPACPPPSSVG